MLFLHFYFIMETSAAQLFSETIGKIVVQENRCSVMPHHVWKRLTPFGPKPLDAYPADSIKFLTAWVHSAHGVESRIENMLLKWDEQSVCFNSPSTMILRKVADGGVFSEDMSTFSYLSISEYWVEKEGEDSWRSIDLKQCKLLSGDTFECPETSINSLCTQKNLEKCSKRIQMSSLNTLFTFVRPLCQSHLVATRVRRATVIKNGNIFDIKPVEIPERILKITLAPLDMMSIGTTLLKS